MYHKIISLFHSNLILGAYFCSKAGLSHSVFFKHKIKNKKSKITHSCDIYTHLKILGYF